MSPIPTSQINIIAVGVENYQFMKRLIGPKKDANGFIDLLVNSPMTGLYKSSQLLPLINPDSMKLREAINNFVINRSAQGDVLIFYFSGHGSPVGSYDFGFCTTDTRFHDATRSVLPLTLLRFRDLVDSLRVMGVAPIVIIDACFSGAAGNALNLSPSDVIQNMQREITRQNATNYALFCSCSDRQYSIGNGDGGIFSQIIIDVLRQGFQTHNPESSVVYIQDVFQRITDEVNSVIPDSTPQLFLGGTMPAIPLVRNAGYTPRRYQFSRYMGEIVASLWNNGEERELAKDEILTMVGRGAYGNHRKLSCLGWGLLEDNPTNKKRRLTERGRRFACGEIGIPNEVIYDSNTGDYIPSSDSYLIFLSNMLE
jgi:hypothetical protein